MGVDFFPRQCAGTIQNRAVKAGVMARAGSKPLEQRGDSRHRKKELVGTFGKRRAIEVPIETECVVVNCVHDECSRSDLRGPQISPMQGVQ